MELIGTHNSGTGEKSYKWYHKLLIPFACCQSKTIREQLKAGCTYFDLRVHRNNKGIYRICHGIWYSEMDLKDILNILNQSNHSDIFFQITIENEEIEDKWKEEIENIIPCSSRLHLTQLNHKSKDNWEVLKYYIPCPVVMQGFLPLDGHSWHTYLPIPWLWKKIYHNNPKWSKAYYKLVDFL